MVREWLPASRQVQQRRSVARQCIIAVRPNITGASHHSLHTWRTLVFMRRAVTRLVASQPIGAAVTYWPRPSPSAMDDDSRWGPSERLSSSQKQARGATLLPTEFPLPIIPITDNFHYRQRKYMIRLLA